MPVTNIMSVDLEDYYCDLPFSEWSKYKSRVVENTEKINSILIYLWLYQYCV